MNEIIVGANLAGPKLGLVPRLIAAWWISENGWSWDTTDNNPGNISWVYAGLPDDSGVFSGRIAVQPNKVVVYATALDGINAFCNLLLIPMSPQKDLTLDSEELRGLTVDAACQRIGESNWAASHYDSGKGPGSEIMDVYASPELSVWFPDVPTVEIAGETMVVLPKDVPFGPPTDLTGTSYVLEKIETSETVAKFTDGKFDKEYVQTIPMPTVNFDKPGQVVGGYLAHTTNSTDSMVRLASLYKVPLVVLKLFNASITNSIPANSSIYIPHQITVKSGQNLGEIASTVPYTTAQLAAWNHLPNPNLVDVGQTLWI